MKDFKKIVVGVDLDVRGTQLTRSSQRALAQAEWLASKNGGEVQLVHSTRTDRYVETHEGQWAIIHEGLSLAGEDALETAAQKIRDTKVNCTISVRDDRPFLAVCLAAIEGHADLVLLGKHEEGSESTKIGSVARNVLRNCPVPVWVVKPDADMRPKVILAATDLSKVGQRAIDYAAFLAKELSSELHVTHAYQIEMATQMSGAYKSGESLLPAAREAATKGVQDQLAQAGCTDSATLHVACNSPSNEILGLDKQLHCDLIVMGMVSREGIPGLILGNTAERVLGRLSSSLLTIKPEGFVSPLQ